MSGLRSERSGLLRVAVAATIWGTIPLLVRATEASPVVIVFFRVFFAGLALATYLTFRGRLGEVVRLPRRKKLALVGMGSLLTLNWVLFFTAITLVDVSVAVLLAYAGPVFVAALTPLIGRQPFDRRVIVPLLLALGGTVLIVGPQGIAADDTAALGAALAFASAITYALLVLNAKRLVADIEPTVYMTFEYLVASVLLAPSLLWLPLPQTGREIVALATLGIVHTALTGFLFLSALRITRADHAAIMTYAEPVSAVVFAAIFLSEPVTGLTVMGGALVIAGGAMVAGMRVGPGVDAPPVVIDGNMPAERERT